MQKLDFIQLVEQRLATLEARLTQLADHRLTDEVKKTLSIAKIDLPFSLAKARYVLELVIRDLYQRELPQEKPKPLFNMIEALCEIEGLFTRKLAADVNYIRINGNLMVHAQEGTVDIQERDVEVIMLVILNLVEWYLVSYMPAKAGTPVAPPVVHAIPPNPYRGLAAFREEDSRSFFGREREAADLVARVAAQPLVAVVGASGSGKSSLVYAGLFPRLRTPGQWRLAAFRPQNRPFYELAKVLAGLLYEDKIEQAEKTKDLAEKLAGGQVELAALVELVLEGQSRRLLLVVDQFEELYTLNPDPELQQRFVDVLLGSIATPSDAAFPPGGTAARSGQSGGPGGLCLLFTLRADFMAHALACAPLAKALDRYAPKLLGPIDDADDLRAVIEQPARQLEIAWEPLLIERILRDLRAQPASVGEAERISLPLLEFTLEQLWQRQTERTLTHLAYEELGGVQRALARHADTVLTHFDAPAQEQLRHIFTQLVCPGEGTEDTRQVATKTQVGEAHWGLVSCLADERLVVTGRDTQGQDTVELIHEALIRHWPPLQQWVAQNRQFRVWQNRLRLDLQEWQQHDHDPSALLRGARLAEAEERLHQQADALSPPEQAYIQASIAQREQAARARRWRQRCLLTGLTVGLLVAVALIGWLLHTKGLTVKHGTSALLDFVGLYHVDEPEMVEIRAGEFWMGSRDDDPAADLDEHPCHQVKITRFTIGKYEVTFDEYDQFAYATWRPLPDDQGWGRDRYPVINVSWEDAVAYADWLASHFGKRYRLPSEAEWEYAARAGTQTRYSFGDDECKCELEKYAWFVKNSGSQTHPVGRKAPNSWGLYDMHGNVWEWVQDNWHENYEGAPVDGSAWVKVGDRPVLRGGSWSSDPRRLRGAMRSGPHPHYGDFSWGFRLARTFPSTL